MKNLNVLKIFISNKKNHHQIKMLVQYITLLWVSSICVLCIWLLCRCMYRRARYAYSLSLFNVSVAYSEVWNSLLVGCDNDNMMMWWWYSVDSLQMKMMMMLPPIATCSAGRTILTSLLIRRWFDNLNCLLN